MVTLITIQIKMIIQIPCNTRVTLNHFLVNTQSTDLFLTHKIMNHQVVFFLFYLLLQFFNISIQNIFT